MRPAELAALRGEAVAFWRGLGVAPVPLVPRGKRPLKTGWQEGSVDAWDGVPLDANLGVLTGPPSGDLVVLDFDEADLCRIVLGITPRALAVHTVVVETTRGVHVYARHAGVKTSVPRAGYSVLGAGSLAVAPPSIHPSGMAYRFVAPPRRIAALTEFSDASVLVRHEPVPASLSNTRSNTPGGGGYGRRRGTVEPGARPAWWPRVEAWMARQSPKLRGKWAVLVGEAAEPAGFDRSGADFVVAVSLAEAGYALGDIVLVLLALPGSKAQEVGRGRGYAERTARAALAVLGQ